MSAGAGEVNRQNARPSKTRHKTTGNKTPGGEKQNRTQGKKAKTGRSYRRHKIIPLTSRVNIKIPPMNIPRRLRSPPRRLRQILRIPRQRLTVICEGVQDLLRVRVEVDVPDGEDAAFRESGGDVFGHV